jgi:hypothetical protein
MIAILAMAAMTNIDGSRMKATQDVGSRGDVLPGRLLDTGED